MVMTGSPFLAYTNYDINLMENIMILFTMKYIYSIEFYESSLNKVYYKASLKSFSKVCSAVGQQIKFGLKSMNS